MIVNFVSSVVKSRGNANRASVGSVATLPKNVPPWPCRAVSVFASWNSPKPNKRIYIQYSFRLKNKENYVIMLVSRKM